MKSKSHFSSGGQLGHLALTAEITARRYSPNEGTRLMLVAKILSIVSVEWAVQFADSEEGMEFRGVSLYV